MKALSIIIPHYNTPKLLCKLLDSIPNIPQIEVLVIDDNSNYDITYYKQCKMKYEKRNVTFYENDPNKKGAGNARNIGLTYAKGKWLLFADADDFFLQDFWSIIKQFINDEADIIYFASTSVILETDTISDRHIYYKRLVERYCKSQNRRNELRLRYQYWSPCAKLIRRKLVEYYGIRFDGVCYANDTMFSTKVGHLARKIKAVDQEIYCITKSKSSLTANTDPNALRIRNKVDCKYYFYIHKILSKDDMKILGYGRQKNIYYYRKWIRNLLHIDRWT